MAFNKKEFKAELRELLIKHDVYIGVDIDGDTHGIQIDGFVAIENKDNTKTHVLHSYNSYLDAYDLTQEYTKNSCM